MPEKRLSSLDELPALVEEVLSILPRRESGAGVIALHGELGAGKTAFVQALGRALGVREHITSPTFVLMKSYNTPRHDFFNTLIHIDAYRIDDASEMTTLHFKELLQRPRTLVAIEWAERIEGLLPHDAVHLTLTHEGDTTRKVVY